MRKASWLFWERKGFELADKNEKNNCQNVTVEDSKLQKQPKFRDVILAALAGSFEALNAGHVVQVKVMRIVNCNDIDCGPRDLQNFGNLPQLAPVACLRQQLTQYEV